jgi:hypothetical protein
MAFDRSKPYGQVFGDSQGASFEQGGLLYDGTGQVLTSHPTYTAETVERALAEKSKRKRPTPTADEPAPINAEDPADTTSKKTVIGKLPEPDEHGDLNLRLWAIGEQKSQWFKVRAAIKARYSKEVATADQARDFLMDEGVVTAAELGE